LILLNRPVRGCATLADFGVVVLEPDPGADDLFHAVAPAEQGESPAVLDGAVGLPSHEHIIAVVAQPDFHVALPAYMLPCRADRGRTLALRRGAVRLEGTVRWREYHTSTRNGSANAATGVRRAGERPGGMPRSIDTVW